MLKIETIEDDDDQVRTIGQSEFRMTATLSAEEPFA
jgi:hypothetical protein